ncbi:serine threonine-kinase [Micractinium conductrix]|uniref:Serine threonine-kinase n=1 Tax=Micractinium conductrix TaxID=554055 RepID=A0A2P6V200_9CHLO|nr:serine threonine-kinase [Micractinium conductrix]|eukprot:PSC68117.1 serine threonine-kinase [Micractinium conductrix]
MFVPYFTAALVALALLLSDRWRPWRLQSTAAQHPAAAAAKRAAQPCTQHVTEAMAGRQGLISAKSAGSDAVALTATVRSVTLQQQPSAHVRSPFAAVSTASPFACAPAAAQAGLQVGAQRPSGAEEAQTQHGTASAGSGALQAAVAGQAAKQRQAAAAAAAAPRKSASFQPPAGPASGHASLEQLRSELGAAAQLPALEQVLPSLSMPPLPSPDEQRAGGSLPTLHAAHPAGGLKDWEVSPDDLEICRRPDGSLHQVGTGGFGRVFKAMRFGVQPVAVKVLASPPDAALGLQEDFEREVQLLRACKDPNIVAFLGASIANDLTLLVLEFCEGGSLSANLRAGRVSWWRRGKQVAVDAARGLAFLHGRRLIHFDLKPANILLDRHGHAKIADLGLARIVTHETSSVTAHIGTLDWAAPELLLGLRCSEKADIYSYGVILWEICTGEVPVRGRTRSLRVPQDCPAEVADLVAECTSPDPSRRPSAKELVERLMQAPGTPVAAPEASPLRSGAAAADYLQSAPLEVDVYGLGM